MHANNGNPSAIEGGRTEGSASTERVPVRLPDSMSVSEARVVLRGAGEAMALVTHRGADLGVVTVEDLASGGGSAGQHRSPTSCAVRSCTSGRAGPRQTVQDLQGGCVVLRDPPSPWRNAVTVHRATWRRSGRMSVATDEDVWRQRLLMGGSRGADIVTDLPPCAAAPCSSGCGSLCPSIGRAVDASQGRAADPAPRSGPSIRRWLPGGVYRETVVPGARCDDPVLLVGLVPPPLRPRSGSPPVPSRELAEHSSVRRVPGLRVEALARC